MTSALWNICEYKGGLFRGISYSPHPPRQTPLPVLLADAEIVVKGPQSLPARFPSTVASSHTDRLDKIVGATLPSLHPVVVLGFLPPLYLSPRGPTGKGAVNNRCPPGTVVLLHI